MAAHPSPVLYTWGQIEVLQAGINPSTLLDGRGAILSWVPQDEIKEFTMLEFLPGKIRGNHFHPEFDEYFLIVEGFVSLHTFDVLHNQRLSMTAGKGFCFRTPSGVSHAVEAIRSSICISLLTKPWDDCSLPIVYSNLV